MEVEMEHLAYPQFELHKSTGLMRGQVTIVENGNFWIEADPGLRRAHKATSCLIEPQVNDIVLMYAESPEEHYILAVLYRESENPAEIRFERGVSIKVNEGELDVVSPDIRLRAEQKFSLSGSKLDIKANEAMAMIDRAKIFGSSLTSGWEKIKTVAQSIETSADRLIQRLIRSYRTVEDFEESKIGRLRCLVKGTFFTKSKKTILKSEGSAKIDAKKIMIG
jgi:hypothetical protein